MDLPILKTTGSCLGMALLLVLIVPKEAWVSKVYYDTISLSRLIERSSLLVAAKGVEPFLKTERKKIQKGDPFSWNVYAFKILSVIRSDPWLDSSYIKKDSLIYVSTFDESNFKSHRDYYGRGLSRVRRVSCYTSPTQPRNFDAESKTTGVVLFLKADGGKPKQFRFTESRAYESIKTIPQIQACIMDIERNGHTGTESSENW